MAALSALSANTVRFLEIQDLDTARTNLVRITDIVARLGALTEQLKFFARRPSGEREAVQVGQVVDNALFLLNHRLKKTLIKLQLPSPATVVMLQWLRPAISSAITATASTTVPMKVGPA